MFLKNMANKFEKIRVIGSGSFGQAWLVCSKQSRRKYVVKEMHVGNMTEKERNQALNEVSILARLKHHHVIRYRHAYVDNNMLCIAMEYADGGDMGAIIYEAASLKSLLAERRILKWFVQICLALQYIHGLNILHRDLKPQNIFVKSDDVVKVGDFGIARILRSSDDHANTAIGTPYYLSPEICCRKSYNQKSDMWAAGCILYELATLVHPFDAADFSLLVVKILTARYKPLNRVYGPFLHDLVSVLLSVNPKGRPSADQILQLPAVKPYLEKNPGCNISSIYSLNIQSSAAMDSRTRRRQTVFFDSRERSRSTVNNKLNSLSLRVNEGQDNVQYPTIRKDITTDSNHNRKEALVFNFSDSHMTSTSPDDKTSVDRDASSVTSPDDGNERSSVSSVLDAADTQISASRNRKYSVNQTMVHLGVTRGSRSDGKSALTPARSASYFNKDNVVYEEPPSSTSVIDHVVATPVNKLSSRSRSSCSEKYSTNRKYPKQQQASNSVSDQCFTPSKEYIPKDKRTNHQHTSSGSVKKHKPLSEDRTDQRHVQTPRCVRSSRASSLKTPSATSDHKCAPPYLKDPMFQTHLIPCTDVVDEKVCKTHTDVLKLADLISTDDDEDMGPESNIKFHAGSKSNSSASSRKRRSNRPSLNDDEDPVKEHTSAMIPDKHDNQSTGNNSIGLEQMYFWARKLAHCDRVNVASVETLRAFLERRVSLLKLKAIRAILKDGDLQDDESLMLIIKDVLQDNLNVLPLILELHFMESKIA